MRKYPFVMAALLLAPPVLAQTTSDDEAQEDMDTTNDAGLDTEPLIDQDDVVMPDDNELVPGTSTDNSGDRLGNTPDGGTLDVPTDDSGFDDSIDTTDDGFFDDTDSGDED